jgi:hypothetical protein
MFAEAKDVKTLSRSLKCGRGSVTLDPGYNKNMVCSGDSKCGQASVMRSSPAATFCKTHLQLRATSDTAEKVSQNNNDKGLSSSRVIQPDRHKQARNQYDKAMT